MGFLKGVRETWRSAPHWLKVRDDRLYERRIVDAVIARGRAAQVVSEGLSLGEERQRLSRAIAELENSRLRRLLVYGHDARRWLDQAMRKRESAPAEPPIEPSASRVAVLVHIFYPDIAAEIRAYVEQIPRPTDLFLTTDTEAKRQAISATFAGWSLGGLEVRTTPNRGRDIAPKLIAFPEVYERYDLVLHLHGKKSIHADHLRLWRCFALETLLPSPDGIARILDLFDRDPALGMAAPEPFRAVSPAMSWGANFPSTAALANRMGFEISENPAPDFPAGSMFWARTAALRPLLDLDLGFEDFPEESGQGDGTLAHAIERLYFYACASAGMHWTALARADFTHGANHV